MNSSNIASWPKATNYELINDWALVVPARKSSTSSNFSDNLSFVAFKGDGYLLHKSGMKIYVVIGRSTKQIVLNLTSPCCFSDFVVNYPAQCKECHKEYDFNVSGRARIMFENEKITEKDSLQLWFCLFHDIFVSTLKISELEEALQYFLENFYQSYIESNKKWR